MKNLVTLVCAVSLLAYSAGASAAAGNGRTLYKWVDSEGVIHYGDRIPPEYASQETVVFNSHGIETGRIDAAKSGDQLAAEEQKRRDAEQAANRDKNLLNTYGAVTEIERLRDQRLALLSDQIKVTSQFLEVLDGRMKKLRLASMHFRPYSTDPNAPPMSDQVAEDLVHVGFDIHTQQQNLRARRNEESVMSRQFESDIARFKELKGIH